MNNNLSLVLFHGTNAVLKPGDWIDPSHSKAVDENEESDYKVAHATTNFLHASTQGSRVYEVSPSSEQEEWGKGHYVSSEGFQVKREVTMKDGKTRKG